MHKVFRGHHGPVTECCFVGSLLLTASMDSTLRVWHRDSGDCLAVLRGHQSPVSACCVNVDAKLLFSSGHDGLVLSWNLSKLLSSAASSSPSKVRFFDPLRDCSRKSSRIRKRDPGWTGCWIECGQRRLIWLQLW